jgi:hypothetical protein
MTATIEVDLEALEGMTVAVRAAGEGLQFSHLLTGDCSAALGSGGVAGVLAEVSVHLARRAELASELVGRLAALPAEFVSGMRAVDEGLAAAAAGGGSLGGGGSSGGGGAEAGAGR